MTAIRFFKNSLFAFFFLTVSLVLCTATYSSSQTFDILQPVAEPQTRANTFQQDSAIAVDKENYITRNGYVQLNVSALSQVYEYAEKSRLQSEVKTNLRIALFENEIIEVIIDDYESTHKSHFLSGHLTNELSSFSITITENNYIITFRIPETDMLYKVVGDMQTGVGYVTESDITQRPPIEHLPARTPPKTP